MEAFGLIGMAVLAGLMATPHCALMCAPLMAVIHGQERSTPAVRVQAVRVQAWVHAGRIAAYALLGAMASALGLGVFQTLRLWLESGAARLILWCLVLLAALMWWWMTRHAHGTKWLATGWARLRRWAYPLSQAMAGHPRTRAFAMGWIWLCLPCGMVYLALTLAAVSADIGIGALVMTGFGVATVPGVSIAKSWLAKALKHQVLEVPWRLALLGVFGMAFTLLLATQSFGSNQLLELWMQCTRPLGIS